MEIWPGLFAVEELEVGPRLLLLPLWHGLRDLRIQSRRRQAQLVMYVDNRRRHCPVGLRISRKHK